MDFPFVPESEGSISESKSPFRNTDASPQLKTTQKRPNGSGSVSRKRKYSETLWDSMDDPSTASWIASLQAGRVNRTLLQESDSGLQTSDGSGATSPESSKNVGLLCSLEKTSPASYGTPIAHWTETNWMSPQRTLLEEWESFSGIWPKWGLCLFGEVYGLPTWAPAMDGRGSSYWPTADQAEYWPSPASMDCKAPNASTYQERGGMTKGEQLRNFVEHYLARNWPTVTTKDSEQAGAGRENRGITLNAASMEYSLPVHTIQLGLTFSQRVRILLPLCRQLRRLLPSPYRRAGSIFKRRLNPDFVDWLMGWPAGWSSVGHACSAEEMELYVFRQRQCLRFLLNDSVR